MPYYYRQLLLKGFVAYSEHVMGTLTGHNYLSALFNLLAVHHLIKNDCEPFGNPERDPQSIKWFGSTDFPLAQLQSTAQKAKPGYGISYIDI